MDKQKYKVRRFATKFDNAYNRIIENHPSSRFLILLVSSCWSIVLTYAGKDLLLRSDTGLSFFGWVITIFVVVCQTTVTSYDAYKKKYKTAKEQEKLIHENAILKTLHVAFDELCDEKSSSLLNSINNNLSNVDIVADPKSQLKLLLKKLEVAVSEMLSEKSYRINSEEIRANMFFNFDNDGWRQINDNEGFIKKETVLKEKSTFKYLINESLRDMVLFCSKHDAFINGRYVPEPADDRNKNNEIKGSIFGYKFARNINGRNIQVAIFCATYNKTFIDMNIINDDAVETMTYNLKNVILKNFEKRAIIELETLYLEELVAARTEATT